MKRKNKKQRKIEKKELIKNKRLTKKYPWLKPWGCWKGNKEYYGWVNEKKYSYIMWDFWPKGWNRTFGEMFLKELGDAVKKADFQDIFHVRNGKEKYGRCILDCDPINEEIDMVITKYEILSENICIICGKPDVHMTYFGWYSPLCFDCYKKLYIKRMYRNDTTPLNDNEIKEKYKAACCDEYGMMQEKFTINNSTERRVVNVKETADKIRKRWAKIHH